MQNCLVVNSSSSANKLCDKGPRECMIQGFNPLELATEADMVEGIG